MKTEPFLSGFYLNKSLFGNFSFERPKLEPFIHAELYHSNDQKLFCDDIPIKVPQICGKTLNITSTHNLFGTEYMICF